MTNPEIVTIRVPGSLFVLLREVLKSRAPELLSALREGCEMVIRPDQKRSVQELIGDEFCASGLGEDQEPNERGLELEKLIDLFSPYE